MYIFRKRSYIAYQIFGKSRSNLSFALSLFALPSSCNTIHTCIHFWRSSSTAQSFLLSKSAAYCHDYQWPCHFSKTYKAYTCLVYPLLLNFCFSQKNSYPSPLGFPFGSPSGLSQRALQKLYSTAQKGFLRGVSLLPGESYTGIGL